MPIIVSQIKTTLDEPKTAAVSIARRALGLSKNEIKTAKLYRSSVDARHGICFVNSVYFELENPEKERTLAEKQVSVRFVDKTPLTVEFGTEQPDHRRGVRSCGNVLRADVVRVRLQAYCT